jgi:alpha-1,6-mannosyltransferase
MSVLGVVFGALLSPDHAGVYSLNTKDLGWLTVAQFSFLSLCMLLAWWSAPQAQSLKDVRLLLAVAVAARLICIPIESYISNDVDRYLFDGKIAISGLDPYQINHNEKGLEELKKRWSPPEEHAQYPTLYPPLSLGIFSLAASAGAKNAPLVWKLLNTAFGIMTVFILAHLLQRLGRLRHLSLAALSPLLILETGIGGHVDAVSTFFVSTALHFYYSRKMVCSGVFVGLGVLTKILPIMLIIPLFFGQNKLKGRVEICTGLIGTVALGYGLTILLGLVPVGSIATLFEKWRFGSPLFSVLESLLQLPVLASVVMQSLVLGSLVLAYKSWRLKGVIAITNPLIPWAMMLVLLLSPVVFPWYLMVLVPFVTISPRPFLLVWLCTIPLTYEVLGGFHSMGEWDPALWPLMVISLCFVSSLYFEFRGDSVRKSISEVSSSAYVGDTQ